MTWKDDLNYGLAAFGVRIPDRLPSLDACTARLADAPATNAAAAVVAGGLLFYLAERGRNPKVNDIWDAMIYTSTCLSVGYSDVFARTPAGKMIGTTLMTLGPALTSRALDGRGSSADARSDPEILATLRAILDQLRAGGER